VRARGLCLAAVVALAGAAAAGCGGVGSSPAAEPGGRNLTVYSSLPLQGPDAPAALQISNGEKLALAQARGHVGSFTVGYVSLDDANPVSGRLDPGAAESNAEMAARDTMTIAYLGDLESPATAVSLPLINAAGIPQVSPGSPYSGLTSGLHAGQDEPARFYPSGVRTFASLQPGDPAQARAQVRLMSSLHVHTLFMLGDESAFQRPLAAMIAALAQQAGISILAQDTIASGSGQHFAGEVDKIVRAHPDAVLYTGASVPAALTLWQELRAADGSVALVGSSALANEGFASQLGDSTGTYLTTPALAADRYPPVAARVLAEYRAKFGGEPGAYALYGYEAMSVVLDAIRTSGARGNDRRAVIARLMQTRDRASVLGTYSIEGNGETTLSPYGVDRIAHRRLVFWRSFPAR
jgi:branched-chain amino acid transport system substrate-binding protein